MASAKPTKSTNTLPPTKGIRTNGASKPIKITDKKPSASGDSTKSTKK